MRSLKHTITAAMIAAVIATGAFANDGASAPPPATPQMGELADMTTSPRQTLLGSIERLKAARSVDPNQHLQDVNELFLAALEDCERLLDSEDAEANTEPVTDGFTEDADAPMEAPVTSQDPQTAPVGEGLIEPASEATPTTLPDASAPTVPVSPASEEDTATVIVDFQPPILIDQDQTVATADSTPAERLANLRSEIDALLSEAISDIEQH